MEKSTQATLALAASITRAASKQTYYTIRLLVDRDLIPDAYRAYAYFRWVDDRLDVGTVARSERIAFVERQRRLIDCCDRGEPPRDAALEEQMLVSLIQSDTKKNSGLQVYLRHMMAVMAFDAERRGRLVSQAELPEYSRWLASAVTEAMHYFIGHNSPSPRSEARYLAVTAAHVTHMLRDTYCDVQAGYYNIPREVLEASHIQPQDIQSRPYRTWVQSRVELAHKYFRAGRQYLARVEEPRCRLAGFAYTARFEWLLDTIEREGYSLRPQYSERRSIGTGLRMSWRALSSSSARDCSFSSRRCPA